MKYYDYEWDLGTRGIILDPELDIDRLGWHAGDVFKLVNINGRVMIQKVDQLEVFLEGKQTNG
jgi:hypothetical protein